MGHERRKAVQAVFSEMTEYTVLRMPWPPSELSPNSRKDRRATTDIRQRYKSAWWAIAKEQKAKAKDSSHIAITFFPPDMKRRDLDNMLGSVKYGLDGLAMACGVDDYGWSLAVYRGGKIKGGLVAVMICDTDEMDAKLIEFRGQIQ